MQITISGELGSGKSTIARALARNLNVGLLSTGAVQRAAAARLGVTTLQANTNEQVADQLDSEIDGYLEKVGQSDQPMVVDSRMAWKYFASAIKVHLVVAPGVAATRVLDRTGTDVEHYVDVADALMQLQLRATSEAHRFRSKYSVDITRLANYDLMVDTSDASVEQVLEVIEREATQPTKRGPEVYLSPKRVIPTGNVAQLLGARDGDRPARPMDTWPLPQVAYFRPFFFAIQGQAALSRILYAGRALTPVDLIAEGDEEIAGLTLKQYLLQEARESWIYDWEDAHGIRFTEYPEPYFRSVQGMSSGT